MKRIFSVILLIGAIVMNTGILCESLCLADSHTSYDTMSHSKHKPSETQACPISDTHNHSDDAKSNEFIKCGCSSDFKASFSEVPLLSETALNLTPQVYLASHLTPYKSSFINVEPISLERPPEIIV